MQTSFPPELLADPAMASSEAVIRKCVHCGFCTATCPTYVLLGDELDSPRGRIYLIKDMLENERKPDAEVVKHIDRCLSCLSCMTTCPSGVNYMHLVDHARAYINEHYNRPWHDRAMRTLLAAILPFPRRLRLALRLAPLAKPLVPLFAKFSVLAPLASMLALAPKSLPSSGKALSQVAGERGRVLMLKGCAEPVLKPQYRSAAIRVLNRLGYEATLCAEEVCCGALVQHMGKEAAAAASARRNIDVWTKEINKGGVVAIMTTASGCGTVLKDYGHLLRNDPAYAARAEQCAALARDISEILAPHDLASLIDKGGPTDGMAIAYHPACSLQHGQKLGDVPKRLLQQAGFDVRLPDEAHLCCGSAGTYNIMQPEIAGQLGKRKADHIRRLNAAAVATGNIGCAVQIGSISGLPTAHVVEFLDWALGGPKPTGLP